MLTVNTSEALDLMLRGIVELTNLLFKQRLSHFLQGEFHASCKESFTRPGRIEGEPGIYRQCAGGTLYT